MVRKNSLPIDTGWAWVITFASCGMFGFVTSGFKSQGVVIVELQELYPEKSAKEILWVFSMSTLCNRLSAPLNGMILTKTSHRTLALIGVSLMSSCLVVFAYLPRVEYMYPVYGLGYGTGAGMVTLATFTAYGPYFDKMKALSLGITAAGSGVMTMIVPNYLRVLFDNLSFSGAILQYAGLCIHMYILASLLRPISFYEKLAKRCSGIDGYSETGEDNSVMKYSQLHVEDEDPRERSFSVGAKSLDKDKSSVLFLSTPNITLSTNKQETLQSRDNKDLLNAYSMQDIATSGIIYQQETTPNEQKHEKESKLNWRLVYDPRCILLGLATIAFVSGLSITYQCVPPLGKQAGVSKQFVTGTLACAGALEIPMRIFNGWLADRKLMTAYTHLTLCMVITGVTALLCAIISSHAGIIIMMSGAACTGTSVMSLLPIANVEVLGKENLYSAMSINYFYQGLALIVSTFSAGAIEESTGRWENVFFFIGGANITGGVILVTAMLITKFTPLNISLKSSDKPIETTE